MEAYEYKEWETFCHIIYIRNTDNSIQFLIYIGCLGIENSIHL
jgi:hypothetical protein